MDKAEEWDQMKQGMIELDKRTGVLTDFFKEFAKACKELEKSGFFNRVAVKGDELVESDHPEPPSFLKDALK